MFQADTLIDKLNDSAAFLDEINTLVFDEDNNNDNIDKLLINKHIENSNSIKGVTISCNKSQNSLNDSIGENRIFDDVYNELNVSVNHCLQNESYMNCKTNEQNIGNADIVTQQNFETLEQDSGKVNIVTEESSEAFRKSTGNISNETEKNSEAFGKRKGKVNEHLNRQPVFDTDELERERDGQVNDDDEYDDIPLSRYSECWNNSRKSCQKSGENINPACQDHKYAKERGIKEVVSDDEMTKQVENQLNQKIETNRDTDYFENDSYYSEPDDDKDPDYDPRKDTADDDDYIPLCRYTKQFQGNYRLTTVPENLGF